MANRYQWTPSTTRRALRKLKELSKFNKENIKFNEKLSKFNAKHSKFNEKHGKFKYDPIIKLNEQRSLRNL